ncbi:MAG: DASH family cryptochrome [Bacteroidota bacterium]
MSDTAIVWFRYDLRLHDNEVLHRALENHDRVLPVYCFDPRHYTILDKLNFRKTDAKRAVFLMQSLTNLRQSLQAKGGNLYVAQGRAGEVLPALAKKVNASAIYAQKEIAAEELMEEQDVAAAIEDSTIELYTTWGRTLYHLDDLPMAIEKIPRQFKAFRKPLTSQSKVRDLFNEPNQVPVVELHDWGILPTLAELGYEEEQQQIDGLMMVGGETEALKRLQYYTFEADLLQTYKYTRNRSLGKDYSSQLSAYLSTGCLSPRMVYFTVKKYEQDIKKNISTYWLIFEILWRDYFQFLGLRYQNKMFQLAGIYDRSPETFNENYDLFERWQYGNTGVPFVDAHMRQLIQTGFMSNRGRVNCASFLSRDYQVDWRWGAAWFEAHLLDYDVCSNWLNWNTQALEIWYTNPVWQGIKYDKKGEYVKAYLPELAAIADARVQAPWMLDEKVRSTIDYPEPQAVYKKWNWAMGKIRKAVETGKEPVTRRGRKKTSDS